MRMLCHKCFQYWPLNPWTSYLASTGREPTFDLFNEAGVRNVNGSYNYSYIQSKTDSLFEAIPCDNQVGTVLLYLERWELDSNLLIICIITTVFHPDLKLILAYMCLISKLGFFWLMLEFLGGKLRYFTVCILIDSWIV